MTSTPFPSSTPPDWSDETVQLLTSGLDFFVEGLKRLVEASDLSSPQAERSVTYAVVHLYGGAELILKARLMQANWTYIVKDIETADARDFASGRFVSVGDDELITRLRTHAGARLGSAAKRSLRRLRNLRNRAQHFVLRETRYAAESAVLRCVPHVVGFIEAECDPAAAAMEVQELLTEATRLVTEIEKDYTPAAGLARALARGRAANGETVLICPDCLEPTLVMDGGAGCLLCNYGATGVDAANDYIGNVLGISGYEIETRGGRWPVAQCPECDLEAFVIGVDTERSACLNCGHTIDAVSFATCSSCGALLLDGEDELLGCRDCIQNAWARFD
jgi:hypothetical protein